MLHKHALLIAVPSWYARLSMTLKCLDGRTGQNQPLDNVHRVAEVNKYLELYHKPHYHLALEHPGDGRPNHSQFVWVNQNNNCDVLRTPAYVKSSVSMNIMLLYPPAAKVCEPPAGIARLAGALRSQSIPCKAYDLNLSCMLELLEKDCSVGTTWGKRAFKNRIKHLDSLRSAATYANQDKYYRAVKDLNHVLFHHGQRSGADLSLSNYSEPQRSPLKSEDLISAAKNYDENLFFPLFRRQVDTLMEAHRFDTIGISITYLSQALTAFAILGYLKTNYPAVRTIAGGGVISSWMSSPSWCNYFGDYIDDMVQGPGEQTLVTMAGMQPNPELGTPDYGDFDFRSYLAPGPILPYAASDGCYWQKCTFCPDQAERNCYRQNSEQRVITEISNLVNNHRPFLLHFLDNAISPALMRSLSSQPPGLPWYGFSRFEKELENLDFCHALKKSGCTMLKLGLESGSQHVLDKMQKGILLSSAKKILENLRIAGIDTYVYLLFGTPHETEDDAQLTREFVLKYNHCITFLNLAIFNMPVCSPQADSITTRFSDGDLSLYCDFVHPDGWDRRSVRKFLQNQFRKTGPISTILHRDPPFFTSNHAPLFCMEGI